MSAVDASPRRVGGGLAASRIAVCWQNPETRHISPVGLLRREESGYSFVYVRNALSTAGFGRLPGFPDVERTYRSRSLFPLFAQRVMDPRRPDFDRYVDRLGLPPDSGPWEQLSRSGGGRQGDLLQMFPEPDITPDGELSCFFLVHGVRHIPARPLEIGGHRRSTTAIEVERALSSLRPGSALRLVPEPSNPVNPNAILVIVGEVPVGWVPDFLVHELLDMSDHDLSRLTVATDRVNDDSAPSHLRLMARLRCTARPSYMPFSGDAWNPLSDN
jgi:hypothetical protein